MNDGGKYRHVKVNGFWKWERKEGNRTDRSSSTVKKSSKS